MSGATCSPAEPKKQQAFKNNDNNWIKLDFYLIILGWTNNRQKKKKNTNKITKKKKEKKWIKQDM